LLGERGSTVVEVAGSWGIVMIITGLCLWWPRGRWQVAGLIYPRLGQQGRGFWRELHSVAGVWVSGVTLLLLLSGLPWTAIWGYYLSWVRNHWAATQGVADWPIGGTEPVVQSPTTSSDQASIDLRALDKLVPLACSLKLSRPVWVSPPAAGTSDWTISSHAQNRPQRVTYAVDAERAEVSSVQAFADLNIVDRVVNIAIAAHEGQWFGWLNQAILLLNAMGILLAMVGAVVMWWRRRPAGTLGAPTPAMPRQRSWALLTLLVFLAALLPLFGLTLVMVLLAEFALLRRLPGLARWLGLVPVQR
jgi:uncharacterized iron-regulated membrane protein